MYSLVVVIMNPSPYNSNTSPIDSAPALQPSLLRYRLPVDYAGAFVHQPRLPGWKEDVRKHGGDSAFEARFFASQKQALPQPTHSLFVKPSHR